MNTISGDLLLSIDSFIGFLKNSLVIRAVTSKTFYTGEDSKMDSIFNVKSYNKPGGLKPPFGYIWKVKKDANTFFYNALNTLFAEGLVSIDH